ncbi:MAG: ATP-binding protein [Paenibacillus sp.]|nr:ATP-binding protein [Paenibacillus sp.]
MESMGEVIKKLLPDRFAERKKALLDRIEKHPEVIRLRTEYPEAVDINRDISPLGNHIACFEHCQSCPGLNGCLNEFPGHLSHEELHPTLPQLIFRLKKCPKLMSYERRQVTQTRIKSHHVPAHIVGATFEDLEMDQNRRMAIAECVNFCSSYEQGKSIKGLYLYGSMGVGKSRIVGAIANELAGMGVDVLMVYVPDFLEEVKDSIETNDVKSKLDTLREVEVLILDDLGAGPLSSWTRDDVLSPVLHRRMESKVTIYTSNLSISELQNYLINVKDLKDQRFRKQHEINAIRIMDRIEPFVKVLNVGGRNRRRD